MPSSGGRFEVTLDGDLIFSKAALKRHAEPGEIEAAPYVSRVGGPRSAGEILAAVDRPGIATSDREARFQFNDELYISAPAGTA